MGEKEQGKKELTDTPAGKGNIELVAGGGLGLLAAGEAAVGVALCPVCVIGAPILLGVGAYKKLKHHKSKKKAEDTVSE